MNLPKLPTDNLYKFLALSGVVLVLFSISFPHIMLTSLKEEVDTLEGEVAVLEIDRDDLLHQVERMKEDSLVTREDVDKAGAMSTDLAKRSALIRVKTARSRRLLTDINWLLGFALVGGIAGLLLTSSGFTLWYYRVQIYQDMVLKKEAGIIEAVENQETELTVTDSPTETTDKDEKVEKDA